MTSLCLVHISSAWGDLLGLPPREPPSAEHSRHQGAAAAERLPRLVESVAHGFDVALLVVDLGDFRRHEALLPGHTERPSVSLPWGAEAWAPLRARLAVCPGRAVEPPPWLEAGAPFVDLGGGEVLRLAGLRPAARDVIATVAHEWDWTLRRCVANGDRLRIVSGRRSLAHLADEAAGIELVRAVRSDGSYAVAHPAELRAELGPAPAEQKALAMIGTWERERTGVRRSSLGDVAARGLLEAHGSAVVAVEMAAAVASGGRLPGVSAATMGVLRAAGADGERLLRRALSVCVAREDAAIDVAALMLPERMERDAWTSVRELQRTDGPGGSGVEGGDSSFHGGRAGRGTERGDGAPDRTPPGGAEPEGVARRDALGATRDVETPVGGERGGGGLLRVADEGHEGAADRRGEVPRGQLSQVAPPSSPVTGAAEGAASGPEEESESHGSGSGRGGIDDSDRSGDRGGDPRHPHARQEPRAIDDARPARGEQGDGGAVVLGGDARDGAAPTPAPPGETSTSASQGPAAAPGSRRGGLSDGETTRAHA